MRHHSRSPRRGGRIAVVGALCWFVVAAAPALAGTAHEPLGDPTPDIRPGPVRVALTTVTNGVAAPVAGITAAGHPTELYVVDQVGFLWDVEIGNRSRWPVTPVKVLDVSDLVVGPSRDGDERGFLGAAFSPGFAQDRLLYTYTSEATDGTADYKVPVSTAACAEIHPADHQSVIREWQVSTTPAGSVTVDRTKQGQGRRVLAFEQPQFNHNGGDLDFGPDRLLYITSGDGGGKDDQDCQTDFDARPMFGHPGVGNGQNLTTPLGKILRIDPAGRSSANGQYAVPTTNPFVSTPGAAREIYAYGFRNPFRASFDGSDLWTADVGQNDVEEVDRILAGRNYGWRLREGAFGFDPAAFQSKGFKSDAFVFAQPAQVGLEDPVANYDHDDGSAVIGGFVYRGTAMPALEGTYVFGDFTRRLNNRHGRLFGLDVTPASPSTAANIITELRDGPIDGGVTGFGQDSAKELYALIVNRDQTGGAVLRMDQSSP
ncbi:MAG TPA: PQQ-dependent sugar dehydrogenase [Propionibacteriaceae bacterium]|nr:PQQ-dependent sugar dehydrogenase [Propionibacteriaceae bacterium]